ncbi:MAG: hypothetical protein N4A64_01075 [Marinisporobacter sp.]|jgi:phage protein D|nr:hypothetical protein [Marinisporobacter sp.]
MGKYKLDTKNYNFLSLEKKYNEFHGPSVKILIEGKDIVQKEFMGIGEIFVETSIDKADWFSFSVVNGYEIDKNQFKWEKDLTVGNKIEIKFGYVDKFYTVFEGYITSTRYEFLQNEGPTIIVSGMDSSFLMMKGKKSFIWTKKKHSDIVKEVAKRYGLKTKVKGTTTQFETIVQNQQTDYDFLRYLADLNTYELFVAGSTLYFRELNSDKTSLMMLEMNKHLIEFSYAIDIADQIGGVSVNGYNMKKEEIHVDTEKISKMNNGKMDGISIMKKLDKTNTKHYIYEPIISKKEAQDRGKSILTKRSMSFIKGEGISIGIPEINAGRYLSIKGLWGTKSRLFYITSSSHSFDENGYSTYFKVGGNAI